MASRLRATQLNHLRRGGLVAASRRCRARTSRNGRPSVLTGVGTADNLPRHLCRGGLERDGNDLTPATNARSMASR